MIGPLGIVVRFALYLDLLLLCGLALFLLHGFRAEWKQGDETLAFGGVLVAAAGIGLPLSVLGMVVLAQSMSGADDAMQLKQHIVAMVVQGTAAGLACAVRIAALGMALLCALFMKRWRTACLYGVAGFASIAVATLAWGGHGAMDEGLRGYVHISADIVHLIAAAGWTGALAAFVMLLRPSRSAAPHQVRLLSRGLTGFAGLGTVIVLALVVTGVMNYWLIVGPTVDGLLSNPYGQLLSAKLALFCMMLVLAAAHRLHLAPRLESSLATANHAAAIVALRRSLAIEGAAAAAILVLVAWLGTLSPSGEM